jgi:hypothetical protein
LLQLETKCRPIDGMATERTREFLVVTIRKKIVILKARLVVKVGVDSLLEAVGDKSSY